MIKLLSLTIAAALFIDAVEPALNGSPCDYLPEIVGWTQWFDRDEPSGTGDWEDLSSLRKEYPGQICPNPVGIEARTLSGLSVAEAGEQIYRSDTTSGFICRKEDQPDNDCYDYQVRFSCPPTSCTKNLCWTIYFNRDSPGGTGDWETLTDLRKENPGKICDNPLYIHAVTADTMTPAISTGQKFEIYNPTEGFACRNKNQTSGYCTNYKVRFVCPCY